MESRVCRERTTSSNALGSEGGARPRRERRRARLAACRASPGSNDLGSRRGRARAHLLLASRSFSAAFACPPPPPRWRFPRGTTEGRFSCAAAPAARFPLPRFRAATARAGAESPGTAPKPCGTAAGTRSVPASAIARRRSAREGQRMSGDAGKKSRRAKRERESASSFSRRLGLTTHRLQRTGERVSVRLALRAVHDSVGEDAHGRRSRQQVVVPQHHLRLRVHRVHARFGVFLDSVRRFPVKLAHGLDPTRAVAVCGVRARSTSPSRATRCARPPRRPVRECRPRARPSLSSRCSFAALFGENKRRDASVCVALDARRRIRRVSGAEGWARRDRGFSWQIAPRRGARHDPRRGARRRETAAMGSGVTESQFSAPAAGSPAVDLAAQELASKKGAEKTAP